MVIDSLKGIYEVFIPQNYWLCEKRYNFEIQVLKK